MLQIIKKARFTRPRKSC